jgi:hypothetical protein
MLYTKRKSFKNFECKGTVADTCFVNFVLYTCKYLHDASYKLHNRKI